MYVTAGWVEGWMECKCGHNALQAGWVNVQLHHWQRSCHQVKRRLLCHLVPWSWRTCSWAQWALLVDPSGTTSCLGSPMWKTGTRMGWRCKLCEYDALDLLLVLVFVLVLLWFDLCVSQFVTLAPKIGTKVRCGKEGNLKEPRMCAQCGIQIHARTQTFF